MNKTIIDLRRRLGVFYTLMLSVFLSGLVDAAAVSPTVSGPVTGGNGVPVLFGSTSFDLATVGYSRSEFFVEGTAYAYLPAIQRS